MEIGPTDALIVVDVQNDFCPGGSLAVPGGDEVIEPINIAIAHFDRQKAVVVATQDWHPSETKHFEPKPEGDGWPQHCVMYTGGAQLRDDLHTGGVREVFQKGTDPTKGSLSGFEGDIVVGTEVIGLKRYLKNNGVTRVFICGLATDYCVKATALDAGLFNFETFVLLDCIRAVNLNEDDEEKALVELLRAGVTLTSSRRVS